MPDQQMSLCYGTAILVEMNLVKINRGLCQLLGYTPEQSVALASLSLTDLFSDSDKVQIENEVELALQDHSTSQALVLHMANQHLGTIPVALTLKKIIWGSLPTVEMTFFDIHFTYSKLLEAREQDQIFRDMILQSAQGILVHQNFKPLFVNESWVKLQGGKSIEQVLTMNTILSLLPPHTLQHVKQRYLDLVEREQSKASNVVENIGLDGVSRYFNIYDNVIDWQGERAVQVVLEDVTEKVVLENKLKYQANHDDMTGLLNRRAVYSWAENQISQHTQLTCLLMDIDDFKQINDNYGHSVGDDVIRALSNSANKVISDVDGVIGRWGGEEFIAFVPHMSIQQTQCIAQTICQNFRDITFQDFQGQVFHATVSIGISYMTTINREQSLDALVQCTDTLLYTAKAKGKNQVCIKNRRHEHLLPAALFA